MFKIGSFLMAAAAALILLAPTNADAALTPAQKKQAQSLAKQLNRLANGATPVTQITSILQKLVLLEPVKGPTYLNTGLKKLKTGAAGDFTRRNATTIGSVVNSAITRSKEATASQKARAISLMKSNLARYISRAPQPPYQAFVPRNVEAAVA